MKIFITGTTGFLGFHIANLCISKGFELLCLKRSTSISLFDSTIENKINWVESDKEGWEESVINFSPDILIHCAWDGVSAESRNNYYIQHQNIKFSEKLYNLCPYKQIIVLGSQEEYGRINSIVDENHPLDPLTEYGKAKIEACKILKEYGEMKTIDWHWIRVFTVYGEKQKDAWLIPAMIKRCLDPQESEMETTKGEQTYSYLYSADFANAIVSIIGSNGKSGIYNLSSSTPTMLKDLFSMIKQKTNSRIVFKSILPYRECQSMMIMGDCTKFKAAFGEFEQTSLSEGLENIIQKIKNIR